MVRSIKKKKPQQPSQPKPSVVSSVANLATSKVKPIFNNVPPGLGFDQQQPPQSTMTLAKDKQQHHNLMSAQSPARNTRSQRLTSVTSRTYTPVKTPIQSNNNGVAVAVGGGSGNNNSNSNATAAMRNLSELFSPVKSAFKLSEKSSTMMGGGVKRKAIGDMCHNGHEGGGSDDDWDNSTKDPTGLDTTTTTSTSTTATTSASAPRKKRSCNLRPSTYTPPPRKISAASSSSAARNVGGVDKKEILTTPTWHISIGTKQQQQQQQQERGSTPKLSNCYTNKSGGGDGERKAVGMAEVRMEEGQITQRGDGGEGGGGSHRATVKVTPAPNSSVAHTFTTRKHPPLPTSPSRRTGTLSFVPPTTPRATTTASAATQHNQHAPSYLSNSPRSSSFNNNNAATNVREYAPPTPCPPTPRTPHTPGSTMDGLDLFVWNQNEIDFLEETQGGSGSGGIKGGGGVGMKGIMSPAGGLLKWDTTTTTTTAAAASSVVAAARAKMEGEGGDERKLSSNVTFANLKTEEQDDGLEKGRKPPPRIPPAAAMGKSLDLLAAAVRKRPLNDDDNNNNDNDIDEDDVDDEEDVVYDNGDDDDEDYVDTATTKKKKKRTVTKKKKSTTSTGGANKKPILPTRKSRTSTATTTTTTTTTKNKAQQMPPPDSNGEITFSLYTPGDEEYINQLHNLIRRDIWEGFVVNSKGGDYTTNDSKKNTTTTMDDEDGDERSKARLNRYEGTVGFRCKHCKHVKSNHRAEKSAVYPRSITRIYLSSIRFQRDHIVQCEYLPKKIKEEYIQLKYHTKLVRGKKAYWVTSAEKRGLMDDPDLDGIVFSSKFKKDM